jgi:dihydroorotase
MVASSLLIQNAQILLPNGEFLLGDMRTQAGKIVQVGTGLSPDEASTILDATGLTLLPGAIDPQVHFREPGLEHK